MRQAFAFLKSNDIECRNGVPHPTIEPHDILQEDIDAHCFPDAAADPDAVCLQRLHDLCLVWPSEIQGRAAGAGRAGELGIAFVEYWLAVPANRWGSAVYSAAQLKTMQEVITLVVFACLLGALSEGAAGLESRARLSLHRDRRVSDFSQMGVSFEFYRRWTLSLRSRRHPQYPSVRTIGQQPQRAVRPLADVPDALVQVLQQAFLRRHGVAVQRQPHQHRAAQRAGEQAAVPFRKQLTGIEGHA